MASLLRQIVAGPRARHPEAGLDLCYVTDNIIATSGPSGTYPQLAYRNPLSTLRKFLDSKHKDNWAIWEFRAEGTGYPDNEVYGRIWHYPYPDHHPPPFALIPHIMASMRNWLHGSEGRVVVVHCKAGKGRSGTGAVSYLIAEEGWEMEKALGRFTERRMRPNFGNGVSIPSQLRWIGYVERWARKGGKRYVERQIEILEVHVWGLRDGVKVGVEGYVDEGRTIKTFHTFERSEMEMVRGTIKTTGFADVVSEVMGRDEKKNNPNAASPSGTGSETPSNTNGLEKSKSTSSGKGVDSPSTDSGVNTPTTDNGSGADFPAGTAEVVFRPSARVVLPTNDINLDVERRSKAAYGLTMVTAVAHVWFNAFFEGQGPERDGEPESSGVFGIEWERMDGIKGSSRKGTKGLDKIAVVWKAVDVRRGGSHIVIDEPAEGEQVLQTTAADWKAAKDTDKEGKDLGLRAESPAPRRGERVQEESAEGKSAGIVETKAKQVEEAIGVKVAKKDEESDDDDRKKVKQTGPDGKELKWPEARGPLPTSADLPDVQRRGEDLMQGKSNGRTKMEERNPEGNTSRARH